MISVIACPDKSGEAQKYKKNKQIVNFCRDEKL